MDEKNYTFQETVKLLKVSRPTIKVYAEKYKIRNYKFGREHWYSKEDVDNLVKQFENYSINNL